MKIRTLLFPVVTVLLGILAAGAVVAALRYRHRAEIAAEFRDRFCRGTRDSIRSDRLILEGGTPDARERVLARFYVGDAMYHSAASVLLCTQPPASFPSSCWMDKDWKCLAGYARVLEDHLNELTQP